jgi:DNA-directed RNA polymerase subunit RPC12/RpoP
VARFIPRQGDWWGTTWKFLLFLGVIVFAITVIEPRRGIVWTILFIMGGLWMFIALMSTKTGYKCGNCGRTFQVPTTVNFFTPSQMGKNDDGTFYSYKKLTCPHCRKTSKARLMKMSRAKGSGKLLK